MLSVELYVDAVIDWWKDKGLTRKSSCWARSWFDMKIDRSCIRWNPSKIINSPWHCRSSTRSASWMTSIVAQEKSWQDFSILRLPLLGAVSNHLKHMCFDAVQVPQVIRNDRVSKVIYHKSSPTQLERATMRCFFTQQHRTPSWEVMTPPLVERPETFWCPLDIPALRKALSFAIRW